LQGVVEFSDERERHIASATRICCLYIGTASRRRSPIPIKSVVAGGSAAPGCFRDGMMI
jgi:hypothetical protein